jgi:hypothetical protein
MLSFFFFHCLDYVPVSLSFFVYVSFFASHLQIKTKKHVQKYKFSRYSYRLRRLSSVLWSKISMFDACASDFRPKCTKEGLKGSQEGPRGSQEGPKRALKGPQ